MSLPHANQRFFASTRGQIFTLLRRSKYTVDELAGALKLTDNAVRAHLATLERDGFVRQHGERRRGGKPAYVYELTTEAEQLFPKPYDHVLLSLLDILQEKVTAQEREALLRAAGRMFATKWRLPVNDFQVRLERAVEVFNELGGLVELERSIDTYVLHGFRCPFAAVVVGGHPEICQFAETVLTELVGMPAQQKCGSEGFAQCSFIVGRPGTEATT